MIELKEEGDLVYGKLAVLGKSSHGLFRLVVAHGNERMEVDAVRLWNG